MSPEHFDHSPSPDTPIVRAYRYVDEEKSRRAYFAAQDPSFESRGVISLSTAYRSNEGANCSVEAQCSLESVGFAAASRDWSRRGGMMPVGRPFRSSGGMIWAIDSTLEWEGSVR